jgi:hypothetical protein
MSDVYKVLAQARSSSSAEVVLYTAPVATSISVINITNTNGAAISYTLSVVPAAEAGAATLPKHAILTNESIASGVSQEIKGGVVLNTGDVLRLSATGNNLSINVSGVQTTDATFTYKVLGQTFFTTTTVVIPGGGYYGGGGDTVEEQLLPVTLYTVPAGKQTTLTSIFTVNHDTVQRTYDLAIVPAGETLSLKHHVRWDQPVAASNFDLVTSKYTLAAGDKLVVFPSTIDKIGFTAFGVEN